MKVLFVASGNKGRFAPFITEQAEALQRLGCEVDFFAVRGKGFSGYLRAREGLLAAIRTFQPDLVHAHYGLCGLLATLQRKVPVVTTFHGSDINEPGVRHFSRLAMRRSAHSIFVAQTLVDILKPRKNFSSSPPLPMQSPAQATSPSLPTAVSATPAT